MRRVAPAQPTHAVRIAQVQSAATPHPWTEGQVRDTLNTDTTRAWVLGEDAVGHILVSVAGPSADVLTIAVHPEHQRQGYARALLQHAHAMLRDQGVLDVFLEVRDTNTPAIGLYDGAGYTTVGQRTAYYRDGSDARVMKLEL